MERVVTSAGMTGQPQEGLVRVRASIHLPGLALGQAALVDPSEPYIAEAIERGYLVREDVQE